MPGNRRDVLIRLPKKFQVCRDRQMKRRASPASAITGGTAACRVVAGVVPEGGGVVADIVTDTGVVTGSGVADVGIAAVSGCVNCDLKKP